MFSFIPIITTPLYFLIKFDIIYINSQNWRLIVRVWQTLFRGKKGGLMFSIAWLETSTSCWRAIERLLLLILTEKVIDELIQ